MKLEEALLLANRPWVETALACGDAQEALDVLADEVVRLQEELTAADNEWKKHKRWLDQVSARAEAAEAKCVELEDEVSYWKDNQDSPYDMKRTIEKLEAQLTKAMRVVEAGDKVRSVQNFVGNKLMWSEYDALRDFHKETE